MSKVSYLISTYNSAAYLDKCIRDLVLQDDQDFDIIIINPNSPDSDDRIAKQWVKRDDRILYYFLEERETYGRSWMRAWSIASTPYVANVNTDDRRHHAFGWRLMDALDKNPNAAFAYSGLIVVDEHDTITGGGYRPPFKAEVFERECHAGSSVMWRTDLLKKISWDEMWHRAGLYNTAFDYWLWLKFMSMGYEGIAVPEPLVYYMQRQDSIEHAAGRRSTWQSLAAIAEFFPDALRRIGGHALDFKDWPVVPEQDVWCEVTKDGSPWTGKQSVNILEL
jgi:glycosyltransferase involved in cell wall biosynthesis